MLTDNAAENGIALTWKGQVTRKKTQHHTKTKMLGGTSHSSPKVSVCDKYLLENISTCHIYKKNLDTGKHSRASHKHFPARKLLRIVSTHRTTNEIK